MTFAPIALFTFKKLEPLKATISALQKNSLAHQSELVIFSDGAKKQNEIERIKEVRAYLKTISGFKKVTVHEAKVNKGLAGSIIEGVSRVLEENNRIIVLEDDLITSTNFLAFMNSALEFYMDNPKILSIAGYTPPIHVPAGYTYDNYFTQRASSWGWATFRNQWQTVDWKVSDYEDFKRDTKAKRRFNRMGSDLSGMLEKQMKGKLDSWAIRWCYHQFQKHLFTVFPTKSKIINIGFADLATHTKGKNHENRFATTLDLTHKINFSFDPNTKLNKYFVRYNVKPYTIITRIRHKLKSLLGN